MKNKWCLGYLKLSTKWNEDLIIVHSCTVCMTECTDALWYMLLFNYLPHFKSAAQGSRSLSCFWLYTALLHSYGNQMVLITRWLYRWTIFPTHCIFRLNWGYISAVARSNTANDTAPACILKMQEMEYYSLLARPMKPSSSLIVPL